MNGQSPNHFLKAKLSCEPNLLYGGNSQKGTWRMPEQKKVCDVYAPSADMLMPITLPADSPASRNHCTIEIDPDAILHHAAVRVPPALPSDRYFIGRAATRTWPVDNVPLGPPSSLTSWSLAFMPEVDEQG